MRVSELKAEMDGKFAVVDERFKDLLELIKSEGETTRRYLDETLNQRITSEHEATRRHFDVVAEKMVSDRNLALDRSLATAQQLTALTASNAGDHVRIERRLDDHDQRLEKIEQGRATDPA